MLKMICLVCFIISSLCSAGSPSWSFESTESGWNSSNAVTTYFHYSEMQRQWAWELLGKIHLRGDEQILDFGCGDGKVSAEISRLVPQGNVLGADISKEMIHFANIKFPPYAFPNLSFIQSNSLTFDDIPLETQYDVICSFCVFHLISKAEPILAHFKKCLKPGGKLVFVVPAGKNPALFKAAGEMFEKYQLPSPWKNNSPGYVHPTRTLDGWRKLLDEAGFQPLAIEMIDTDTPFFSKEELIISMMGTTAANWNIPWEIAHLFFKDLVERMFELDPDMLDQEGRIHYKLSRIHVLATH